MAVRHGVIGKRWLELGPDLWKGGKRGANVRPSPFGKLDEDFDDWRALHLSSGEEISGATFASPDLSSCRLDDVSIRNCRFDGGKSHKGRFARFVDDGNVWRDFSFVSCDFSQGSFGYGGSIFYDCTFDRCKLMEVSGFRAKFVRCRFERCKWGGVDWKACRFSDCDFIGRVEDSWFRGRFGTKHEERSYGKATGSPILGVDWSLAELRNVFFSHGVDLSTVVLPKDGRLIRFSNIHKVIENVRRAGDNGALTNLVEVGVFVRLFSAAAFEQRWWIFDVEELEDEFGKGISDFVSSLPPHL